MVREPRVGRSSRIRFRSILYNRRFLEESLAREIHRTNREGVPLCVAMLDLDFLKQFNDTYGHEAGDRVLRELGRVLREKLRKSDISCRFGGEEFVLVLPGSTLADAEHRVEQIRLWSKGYRFGTTIRFSAD